VDELGYSVVLYPKTNLSSIKEPIMLLSILAAIIITAIFVGAIRKKAAYGIIIIAASAIMRVLAFEAGDDVWWASCMFMIIGAGYCFYPMKAAKIQSNS